MEYRLKATPRAELPNPGYTRYEVHPLADSRLTFFFFPKSVLESAPMPSAQNPPRETAAFVNANAAIKVLKDSNDREAKTVELLTQEVGAVAEQFQKLHETLTRRIGHLEQMEEKCELAESGLSDAD